jgi:hypothetical protein
MSTQMRVEKQEPKSWDLKAEGSFLWEFFEAGRT